MTPAAFAPAMFAWKFGSRSSVERLERTNANSWLLLRRVCQLIAPWKTETSTPSTRMNRRDSSDSKSMRARVTEAGCCWRECMVLIPPAWLGPTTQVQLSLELKILQVCTADH